MDEPRYRKLGLGEHAPWFHQRSSSRPVFAFDSVGGRYLVMCFFGRARGPLGRAALEFVQANRACFDDDRASFFGVSSDPDDERTGRVGHSVPGIWQFWDFDGLIARLYGALPQSGEGPYRQMWVVLNPGLQVIAVLHFRPDGSDQKALSALLARLPPVSHYGGVAMHAPILIVPEVFDRSLCELLIASYEAAGGQPTGFMQDVEGKTVAVLDPAHKRRSDHLIEDTELIYKLQRRVMVTVVPAIQKAHCFEATQMERYLVGCYDSSSGGHFAPHRDNTTLGTAHRRFAVSVNLNNEFEGGELGFPEYGPRTYKVARGSAIVFGGALLHRVTPVTRGRRYAFLPFLYDDAAAALREKNLKYLAAQPAQHSSAITSRD